MEDTRRAFLLIGIRRRFRVVAKTAAKRRLIERMRNARSRGTGGRITWRREEIHER